MLKTRFHLLAIYELGRLLFFLSLNANLSGIETPFGWYIAGPLLGVPFVLLYVMFKATQEKEEAQIPRKIFYYLFVMQKIASTTGLVLYTIQYMNKISINVLNDGIYFIEMIPFIVIFFTIDAILCTIMLLKQRNNEKGSEE